MPGAPACSLLLLVLPFQATFIQFTRKYHSTLFLWSVLEILTFAALIMPYLSPCWNASNWYKYPVAVSVNMCFYLTGWIIGESLNRGLPLIVPRMWWGTPAASMRALSGMRKKCNSRFWMSPPLYPGFTASAVGVVFPGKILRTMPQQKMRRAPTTRRQPSGSPSQMTPKHATRGTSAVIITLTFGAGIWIRAEGKGNRAYDQSGQSGTGRRILQKKYWKNDELI